MELKLSKPSDMAAVVSPPSGSKDKLDLALKRIIDVMIATSALIFAAPLLLVMVIALKIFIPGPLIFAHRRLGKGGKEFYCLKFRTMAVNSQELLAKHLAENPEARAEWARDHKLRNDPRVTPLGSILRRSSLDELPQLINVLRGEMSMVGPRPIVVEEVQKYGRYIIDYASVTPGITGLWQVSGRNDTNYRRRVAIDASYARNRSTLMDLAILARTVPAVMMTKGSY